MPLDPVELHLPRGKRRIELHPEILIQHGLTVRLLPPALLPRGQPKLCKGVLQILTVRIERNARPLRHGAECHQCRRQLHAVVRRLGGAAALLLDRARRRRLDHGSPAARTARVTKARTVRVDDVVHIRGRGLCHLRSGTGLLRPCIRTAEPRPRLFLRHKALVDGSLKAFHLCRALCPDGVEPRFAPALYRIKFLCHQ